MNFYAKIQMKRRNSNKKLYIKKPLSSSNCCILIDKGKQDTSHVVRTINIREIKTLFVSESQMKNKKHEINIKVEDLRSKFK